MDTRKTLDYDDCMKTLKKQQRISQNAPSQKGKRPKETRSREEIIKTFLRQMQGMDPEDYASRALGPCFRPLAYPPCVEALGELKKAMIRDLVLETHHRGSYIVLRAATRIDLEFEIMLIVEDETNDVVMLTLCNQGKALIKHSRLAEGTVVIVKEPYLEVMGNGDHGIRVDHLSDIWLLSEHDVQVPGIWGPRVTKFDAAANDWKIKGNKHFYGGNYSLAIEFYSKALESSPTADEALAIRRNRALTYLHSHQFDAALRDCNTVLTDHKFSEEALFRKAQALYNLQRFRESCDTHCVLAKKHPENKNAKAEFKRARARLAEQQTGRYQFKRMQLEAKKLSPPSLDHATYIGPVEVRLTEARGHGLFTSAPVEAGDLLICEKAFAHSFHNPSNETLSLLVNLESNRLLKGTRAELIKVAAQKLYENPSLASTFNDLHRGLYEPVNVSEVDGKPVVDTFLIERVTSLNAFGCPRSCRQQLIRNLTSAEGAGHDADKDFGSTGIWPFVSYINHACYNNACGSFIGDMMIVRATQDIPANTEITLWYRTPADDHSLETRTRMHQHWGFKCRCIICQDILETPDSELNKRRILGDNLRRAFKDTPDPNPIRIEAIIAALERTYRQSAIAVPRLSIWTWYFTLSTFYASRNCPLKAVETALKALASLSYIIEGGKLSLRPGSRLTVKKWGLILSDETVSCWMVLSKAYRALGRAYIGHSEAVEEYAKVAYRACIGENETFDDTFNLSSKRVDGLIVTAK